MAWRSSGMPSIDGYWFQPPTTASAALRRTSSGPASSGKPCPRLTAACSRASCDITSKTETGRSANTGFMDTLDDDGRPLSTRKQPAGHGRRRGLFETRARSGGADRVEELLDLDLEVLALVRQRLCRHQHLRRGRAGLVGPLVDVDDVAGDLRGAVRGLLHVARDFVGGGTLLLDRGRDGRGDLGDAADRAADLLDG